MNTILRIVCLTVLHCFLMSHAVGQSDTLTQAMRLLLNPAPVVHETWSDQTFCPVLPDLYCESYSWDFGDGFTANGNQVCHQYPDSGEYAITLVGTLACDSPAGHIISDTVLIPVICHQSLHNNLTISPNPTTSNTTIQYTIPNKTHVKAVISDFSGNLVTVLANEEQPTGQYAYQFDADNFGYSSGGQFLLTWTLLGRTWSYTIIELD